MITRARTYIDQNPELVDFRLAADIECGRARVRNTAEIHSDVELGRIFLIGRNANIFEGADIADDVKIHEGAKVGAYSVMEDGSRIGAYAEIGEYSYVCRRARIGKRVVTGARCFFGEGAIVPGIDKHSHHRECVTYDDVIVGADVTLPEEFQLGFNAVVPDSTCITTVGRFGESKRMVTVYGGLDGEPLYGVGCQYGITEEQFLARIKGAIDTSAESAASYRKGWARITFAGMKVQKSFELHRKHAEELIEEARTVIYGA